MSTGSKLYFTTNISSSGAVWQSDGTTAGTTQVSGVGGGTGVTGGRPGSLTLIGSTLYLSADSNGASNFQLYKYTGSGSATQFTSMNNYGDIGQQVLQGFNGYLFWGNLSSTGIVDLYRYDPVSTNIIKLTSFSSGSSLSAFVPDANGTSLFFNAYPGNDGSNSHWYRIESDGTGFKDLTPTGKSVNGIAFLKVGSYYYMTLTDNGTLGTQIWRSDGTTANGATLFSTYSGTIFGGSSNFVVLGTKLYFSFASGSTAGNEPGFIDTTDSTGTPYLLNDLFTGATNSSPNNFTVVGGKICFSATIATSTIKVFQSDGTSAGTVQVAETKSGGSDAPNNLTAVGTDLYYKAQTTTNTTANQRLPFILSSVTVAAPTVTSISPTSGPIAGGTSVVITGTNLTGATAVNFGANSATGVVVNSPTQITATAPAGSAGIADVTVTTAGGTSATGAGDQFTYTVPAPTVASISSTKTNGSYKATTLIPITVTFSAAVTVTGTPTLALNSGGSASYSSGSGTSTLTFNYIVGVTDNATLLDCTSTSALALAGGTINATTGGTAANLTLPTPGGANSLGINKAIVIDTTAPTILSINRQTPSGQITAGSTVTFRVTYSEGVTVPGGSNFSVIAVNGSSIVGTVTGVTGSGSTRDVSVSITSGTGEFSLRAVN